MKVGLALALFLLTLACPVAAQERQTANTLKAPADFAGPAATLADMKWLVGHWKGTGLGGVSEEIWTEPAGGVMMGMYRLVQVFLALRDKEGNVREEEFRMERVRSPVVGSW